MWSDELHKKVQDAESSSDSSGHEKAWEKMEQLLDEHLPVKKKRRRFIFLLFPILLGTGVALFFIQKSSDRNHPVAEKQKNNSTIPSPATHSFPDDIAEPAEKKSSVNAGTSSNPVDALPAKPASSRNDNEKQTIKNDPLNTDLKHNAEILSPVQKNRYPQSKKTPEQRVASLKQALPKVVKQQDDVMLEKTPFLKDRDKLPAEPGNTDSTPASNPIAKTQITDSVKAKTDTASNQPLASAKKPAPKKSSFNKNLSLNFSVGPDINSVGADNPGKTALQYGIGISYALSEKISIRAGFFAGRKKYDADSVDYHPPANFWNYYSNLQKIDADCFVYEIPLSVVYNFSGTKKHHWFVAGGLSSYLMKKEEYYYHYKNAWGQPQLYHRTYKNENSHFFSVINLSGGYKYHLNDRISIIGEPYARIPVNGVGYGKVKLNSAGVMFTLNVKPFLKKD